MVIPSVVEESIKKIHYPSSVFCHQSSILCPYPPNLLSGFCYFKTKNYLTEYLYLYTIIVKNGFIDG